MLSAQRLVKTFGSLRAVDGVDFEVAQGSITGLIGPNGAGKSTLFDLLAGGQRPGEGEIRFRGERIDGASPDLIFRKGLARTFQVPRPFAQMTVLENLMLVPPAQAGEQFWNNWWAGRRIAAEERATRERAMEMLALCALAEKSAELAGRLSGGQQKLLELARVLMIDPKLILLDEPAAGVNPALLETLIERIVLLNQRGISFLIIEHNMDLVMGICEPIVVMAQGKVIFRGDADSARRDPRVLDAYLGDLA